jgi:hypothetical protein
MKGPFARTSRLIAALVVALFAGCAGARVSVTAERARYPISFSGSVRDANGELRPRSSLVKVGELAASQTRMGFFYSGATPRSSYDISDEVNAQVEAAHGEAVVYLTITVSDSCNVLNAFPVLNALPFWPGCVPLDVTGEIVRRRPSP